VIQLGYIDPLRAIWWWSRVYKTLQDGDMPGHKRLPLTDHPQLAEWNTIRSLLQKVQRLSEVSSFRLENAAVEVLEPNVAMPFTDNTIDDARVYVVLHCQYPRSLLYEDVAAAALVSGHVWAIGGNAAKSALANFGSVPAVNLVLRLKRERQEEPGI
jgi:hypothetical protein